MNNDPVNTPVDLTKLHSSKTENYIILKPIAERFNRIAKGISDDEIKQIIKDEIRKQVKQIDFSYSVQETIDEFLDDNKDMIVDMYKKGLQERFK